MSSPRNSYRSKEITLDLVYKVRSVLDLAERHYIDSAIAATPEEFYFELLAEPKTFNFLTTGG